MHKGFIKILIVVAFLAIYSGTVLASEQTINVNVNQTTVTEAQSSSVFSLGITSPIFGTATNKYYGQEKFTTRLMGINWLLGFTVRNYLGQGLPTNGGSLYFDYGTVAILVPFLGIGYSHRVNGNLTLNIGIPEGLSLSFDL